MSLLFDALKRAQGDAEQPGAPKSGTRTMASRRSGIWPYVVAGLVLLTAGLSWVIYQQNQTINAPVPHPEPAIAAIEAASQPAAASAVVAVNALPATGADRAAPENKSWTHPLATKKPQKRKQGRKPVKPAIPAGSDPLREGYLALSAGRLDQAERSYLDALARHPHEKDALLGLAVIAQRKMQVARATELYRQVLREDLGNAAAAAGLVSLSMQADPVAAESQLRELLDIKPAAPELHYALGNVLARQLRWGEAQQAFFRACNLAPDNALYAYNLAVSLDRLHQPAAALPYYQKAEKLARPGDPTLDGEVIARRIQELSGSR